MREYWTETQLYLRWRPKHKKKNVSPQLFGIDVIIRRYDDKHSDSNCSNPVCLFLCAASPITPFNHMRHLLVLFYSTLLACFSSRLQSPPLCSTPQSSNENNASGRPTAEHLPPIDNRFLKSTILCTVVRDSDVLNENVVFRIHGNYACVFLLKLERLIFCFSCNTITHTHTRSLARPTIVAHWPYS